MKPLDVDLSGRVALVTGATSGMGKETARELARIGAEVILGCRSRERGEATRSEITDSTGATAVTVINLDLSSLASVRAFVTALSQRSATLDVLVNNAAASLSAREVTPEGFERHWATNVLGPYLLTTLLIPALRASGHGRIVTVSTRAAGGLDLSDTQYERRRYRGIAARDHMQLPRPGADPEAPRCRRAACDGLAPTRGGASPSLSYLTEPAP